MEPLESNELPEQDLDRLLREWKSPPVPAGLAERVRGRLAIGGSVGASPTADSWWGRFWNISIRIPLPVACCLAILLAVFAWRWKPSPEVPKFQPVLELRPRIIKVQNAD